VTETLPIWAGNDSQAIALQGYTQNGVRTTRTAGISVHEAASAVLIAQFCGKLGTLNQVTILGCNRGPTDCLSGYKPWRVVQNFLRLATRKDNTSMVHKNKVLDSINDRDAHHCVDIFVRPDGTIGFEEFRRDFEDDRGWFPIGYYSSRTFDNQEEALQVAISSISWLGEAVKRR